MKREEAEAIVRSVTRRCRGPLDPKVREDVNKLLADGQHAKAAALDAQSRKGCGADFNDVVMAGPLDGKEHAYTCGNKCGVTGVYTAPLFVIE